MQQISIDELKAHPRNNEFFDDMTGDAWDAFVESIKTSGVIEPIVITPDKIIISGHQRVRACKALGITSVMTDMRAYSDEDQILKDLIETNIRQRGVGNPNPVKLGRCIKELERIYGIQNGGDRKSDQKVFGLITQEQLADTIGITTVTLRNYKKLTELVPELQDWVETGILAPTTATAIVKYMSPEEQEEFVSSMDVTQKITRKQVQQYIEKIKELESRKPEVIDNTDYTSITKLERRIKELEAQKKNLEQKIELNKEDAERFNKLKSDIDFLTKQKADLGRQINSATELAELTVSLQKVLEKDLAPIKFKRCMERIDTSDVAVKNLSEIIDQVDKWSSEMKTILGSKYEYIIDMQ
jgi:ParB family chromosome partitioning protein